jgi:uncharacterized membrane protein
VTWTGCADNVPRVRASTPTGGPGWRAARRLGIGLVTGIATFLGLWLCGIASGYAALGGWDVGSGVFLLWVWTRIGPLDKQTTARHAQVEDPSRSMADATLISASVVSLFAVGYTLVEAGHHKHGWEQGLMIGLAIASVVLAWATVHTVYTLRYAHLYYTAPVGGIDYHNHDQPDYIDLLYVALTIGMTFHVSDTDLQSRAIRHMAIRHALLSYVFGAVIVAITINFVATLLAS